MKIFSDFLDLLFPRTCESCSGVLLNQENIICSSCLIDLPIINIEVDKNELLRKFSSKIKIENAYAFLKFTKKGKVQKLLHRLKYQNKPEIGRYLGKLFGTELKKVKFDSEIDLIVSVPLHKQKSKQRGYNQVDCIGEGLSESLKIPFRSDLIERIKYSETQTKKTRYERFQNVENIFEVININEVAGKRIALVDDVLTTGSTLEACGETLINAGCKELSIITIALAQ